MNGKVKLSALALVGVLVIGGIFLVTRTPAAGAPISITADDAGKTITLRPGDTLIVTLEGNPSTGYNWERAKTDEATVLKQIGDAEFQADRSDVVGGPGKIVLRFEAAAAGQTTLHLVYHRSWESEAPQKDFQVTVVVK